MASVIYSELFVGTFDHTTAKPVVIFEDNTGNKALAESFMINKRSRHFRFRLYYVRQQVGVHVVSIHNNGTVIFTQIGQFTPNR